MQRDEDNFYLMHYMSSAVIYAVEHCLAGRKAKTELIKEPILAKMLENERYEKMTDEQKYEHDVQKALIAEQAWIANDRMRGLPETIA